MKLASGSGWEQRFFDFLELELAPSPARWRATLRVLVACAVAMTLIQSLQLVSGQLLTIAIFIVCMSDSFPSPRRAVFRVLGVLLGGALSILSLIAFGDKPWILYPEHAAVVATCLYLMRTSAMPHVWLLVGVTYLSCVPEFSLDTRQDIVGSLRCVALMAGGALLGTAAQLLVWPTDPERLLRAELGARLAAVEAVLARALDARAGITSAQLATELEGLSGPLLLLDQTEGRARLTAQQHSDWTQAILGVALVATEALRLERTLAGVAPAEDAAQRLRSAREECARLRAALRSRTAPEAAAQAAEPEPAKTDLPMRAALQMEISLHGLRAALERLARPSSAGAPRGHAAARRGAHLLPAPGPLDAGAFQAALKAALAAAICAAVTQALAWPGLGMSMLMCLFVPQLTLGASYYKNLMAFCGSLLGASASLIAIVILMPNLQDLAGLLVASTALLFPAAWLMAGSSRIAYVGVQAGLATSLVLFGDVAPGISLVAAGNRIAGILLGIAVVAFVEFAVWPARASDALARVQSELMRALATFLRRASLAAHDEVFAHTSRVCRGLEDAQRLAGEARFEPVPSRVDGHAEHERIARITARLQSVLLELLALHHAPLPEVVPAELQQRVQRLDAALADELEILASMQAHPAAEPESPDSLERALLPFADASLAVAQRLRLYRALERNLDDLAADLRAGPHTPTASDRTAHAV